MKDLPYFKFYASEWLLGDITLFDYDTQGIFINICAFYWARKGDVDLCKLKRKFMDAHRSIDLLLEENLISINKDKLVSIRFLDEQLGEVDRRSLTSATNGKKGGRPPKPKKPIDNLIESNIEEKRGEEKKEENINIIQTPSSFDPNETFKPSARAYQVYYEIWENWKPFNPNDPKMKSSYFEACNVAGGEEIVNLAAEYYIEFTVESGNKQFLVHPRKFLDERMFNVDYSRDLKELKRKQRSGK